MRAAFLCLHFRFVLYQRMPTGAKAGHRTLMKLSLLPSATTWEVFDVFISLTKGYDGLLQNVSMLLKCITFHQRLCSSAKLQIKGSVIKNNWVKKIQSHLFTAKFIVQSNADITNNSGPVIFYNWVVLCTKNTNLTLKYVCYNRVFVNNRVRYNRVWQYLQCLLIITVIYSDREIFLLQIVIWDQYVARTRSGYIYKFI